MKKASKNIFFLHLIQDEKYIQKTGEIVSEIRVELETSIYIRYTTQFLSTFYPLTFQYHLISVRLNENNHANRVKAYLKSTLTKKK